MPESKDPYEQHVHWKRSFSVVSSEERPLTLTLQTADMQPRVYVRLHAPGVHMIQLTRLNKKPLMVNAELIKFVEANPDTVITLVSGEKIVVLESPQDVAQLIFSYRVEMGRGISNKFASKPAESPAPIPPAPEEL